MKRYNNLYKNICNIENIMFVYKKICNTITNHKKRELLRENKAIYINRIYKILNDKNYHVGKYNKFIIHDSKKREIYSQNIQDKIINHLVSRYILYPALMPCLLDVNVASRKNKGSTLGLYLASSYRKICNIKYNNFYILKCDISKFFLNINHDILKKKLLTRIKDKDALKIVFEIIDSNKKGLYIGSMTSQVFAIFYLNDLDHFIKEHLKVRYYVRYQDDFLLFHNSKKYLQYCLEEIKRFLKKEKLELNSKTRIYKNTNNFIFLGRDIYGNYARHKNIRKKLKLKNYKYNNNYVSLNSFASTIIFYNNLCNDKINLKNIYKKRLN